MRCKICGVTTLKDHCTECVQRLVELKQLLQSMRDRRLVRIALLEMEKQEAIDAEETEQQELMSFTVGELKAMQAKYDAVPPGPEGGLAFEKSIRISQVLDRKAGKPHQHVYGQLPHDIAGMY